MGCLVFGGHGFAPYCSCEVLSNVCVAGEADAVAVPGVAGRRLLGSRAGVREIRVRLRQRHACNNCDMNIGEIGAAVSSWLSVGAAELELPGLDGFYRDAVCVKAGPWERGRDGVCCEVAFCCYDPVRYGDEVTVSSAEFAVSGNRPVWPVVEVQVAAAGDAVAVGLIGGRQVRLQGVFVKDDIVIVDCGAGTVTLNGVAAEYLVDPASDFFQVGPGSVQLGVANCAVRSVKYRECWM